MGRTAQQVVRAACLALGAALLGCQASGGNPTPMVLTQTPPTVQAAFNDHYAGTVIQNITRTTQAGQDLYTVQYAAPDGGKHDVVYNGAGDEVDKH